MNTNLTYTNLSQNKNNCMVRFTARSDQLLMEMFQ